MDTYDLAEAARRIGVSEDELRRFVELGIVTPLEGTGSRPGTCAARAREELAARGSRSTVWARPFASGQLWLDFLDAPAFERFSALSGHTFAQLAERTGVPIELLLFIREAAGSAAARPGRSHP